MAVFLFFDLSVFSFPSPAFASNVAHVLLSVLFNVRLPSHAPECGCGFADVVHTFRFSRITRIAAKLFTFTNRPQHIGELDIPTEDFENFIYVVDMI